MSKAQYLIFFLFIFCFYSNFAQDDYPQAAIKEILKERVDKYQKNVGIVVGVIDKSGSYVVSYGKHSHKSNQSLDGNTLFEIGSITKVFTGLILSEMIQRGEIKLEDPIAKYLPSEVKCPSRNGKEITLLHLTTHTSSLPRMPGNMHSPDLENPFAHYTVKELYEFLGSYNLPRDIGSKWEYSNLAVGLLGHILTLKAGMSYEELVQKYVSAPLGLEDTVIKIPVRLKACLAQGHNVEGRAVPNWDLRTLTGAGALRSNANDMLKFLGHQLGFTKTSLTNAIDFSQKARYSPPAPLPFKMGLGWLIQKKHGTEIIWHNGGTGGYRAFAGFCKEKGLGIVVLTNSSFSADDIGFHLLNKKYALAKLSVPRSVAKVDPKIYQDYVGEYKISSLHSMMLSTKNNKLYCQLTGQQKLEIYPESESKFFYKVVDAQISFVRDASGKVDHLILHQNGEHKAPKVSSEAPKERVAIKVDPKIYQDYVGEYELTPQVHFTITQKGNTLLAQVTGQLAFEIFPESENKFFYKVVDAQITFVRDTSGNVTQLILHQNGEQKAKKLAPPKPKQDFAAALEDLFLRESLKLSHRVLKKMSKAEKKSFAKMLKTRVKTLPQRLAQEFIRLYASSFVVEAQAAEKMVAGQFDTKGNLSDIKATIKDFEALSLNIPPFGKELLKQLKSGAIKEGIALEFAKRLLAGHLDKSKKELAALQAFQPEPKKETPKTSQVSAAKELIYKECLALCKILLDIEVPPNSQKMMAEGLEVTVEKLPNTMADQFVGRFPKTFFPSEEEAAKIVAGKFNDQKNLEKLGKTAKALLGLNQQLPNYCQYLIGEFNNKKLVSGLRLVFATRLLDENLQQFLKIRGKEKKKAVKKEDEGDVFKAQKLLLRTANKIFEEVISEMSPNEKKGMLEHFGGDLKQVSEKMTQMLKDAFPQSFVVTLEEATKILAGEFDNVGNQKEIEKAIKMFQEHSIELPTFVIVLVKKHRKKQLKNGIELEFARRILVGFLERLKK